jgi:hypothetical protein
MHPHSSLTFRFQVGALAEVHPRSSPVSIRTHHDSIPRSRRCVRHRDFERRRGCFADGVPRYVTTRDSITCIVRFIGTKTQCAVVLVAGFVGRRRHAARYDASPVIVVRAFTISAAFSEAFLAAFAFSRCRFSPPRQWPRSWPGRHWGAMPHRRRSFPFVSRAATRGQ